MKSEYKVCPKCGLRHSALVRHRCAKPKDQPEKPKFDPTDHDFENEGETESTDQHGDGDGPEGGDGGEGEGRGKGKGKDGDGNGDGDKSEGEGSGQGESDGDGDGSGKGEGEGEGEGEGRGPAPQPPEPEARPEAIICTVLKFAALTAQCAKNGTIEITVTENGLMVYGHNGDQYAMETMTWKDFEDRSTVDGEFFVKEVIDKVDATIMDDADKPMAQRAAEAMAKSDDRPYDALHDVGKADKPKLTLPLTAGQRVVDARGTAGVVSDVFEANGAYESDGYIATVHFEDGNYWDYRAENGLFGGWESDPDYSEHLSHDA